VVFAPAIDPSAQRRRVDVAGVLVDRIDEREATAALERFVADGRSHQVVTVNTDFVRIAGQDPGFRAILNGADLAVADGMPVVWLSRLRRAPLPARITGLELVEESCRIAARDGIGVFLLGAAPGIAAEAATVLAARHPGLHISGTFSPPFGDWSADEERRIVDTMRAAGRSVLLVAFGAPRQDRFIRSHLGELDIPIAMGVGCAFDVIAGRVRRAPRWIQSSGLEWLWRVMQEPRRLWRRYFLQDIPLIVKVAAQSLRDARGSSAGST
jgi:N-acetylglucosaminyldiphosphoundecaprenol N-acetyl-beta-D-mannosaminyltransferase